MLAVEAQSQRAPQHGNGSGAALLQSNGAMREALAQHVTRDPTVVALGVGEAWGGALYVDGVRQNGKLRYAEAYAAAKSALLTLMQAIAQEERDAGGGGRRRTRGNGGAARRVAPSCAAR